MIVPLDKGQITDVDLNVYRRERLIDERTVVNERAPHLGNYVTHTPEIQARLETQVKESAMGCIMQ
jgi:hypothetical protein